MGDFETRARPLIVDSEEYKVAEQGKNNRVNIICNFKVEENYIVKKWRVKTKLAKIR